VDFVPALSPRALVQSAEVNGKAIRFHIQSNTIDQHVTVQFPACAGPAKLVLRVHNDFGLSLDSRLPALGATSAGLRVLSESWSPTRDILTLEVSGAAAQQYDLAVLNPGQIRSMDGAELIDNKLRIQFPAGEPGTYTRSTVTLHFNSAKHSH